MVKYDKTLKCKVYPVCWFEHNQHKLDWHITKLSNDIYDDFMNDRYDAKKETRLKHLQDLMILFNSGVCEDGLVYMPWEQGQEVKELLVLYDETHKY